VDFGVFRYGTYLNEWDFYHYYLGTSTRTSWATPTCTAPRWPPTGRRLALPQPRNQIRDLTTAQLRDVSEVAAESARYRARFSDSRWREFVADVTWFKMQLPAHRWSLLLADHGYNGTPAWSFVVGGLVSRHLSVRNPVSRWLMLALDPLLLLAATVAVAWAFGLRTAFLMVIFIGTHYLLSWGHLKGALLRTDFAMASVLAVCLVKQRYHKIAGVLLAGQSCRVSFQAFCWSGRPYSSLCGSSETATSIDNCWGFSALALQPWPWWSWDLVRISARQRSGTSGTSRFLRTIRTPATGIPAFAPLPKRVSRAESPCERSRMRARSTQPCSWACPAPSWPCSCSCPP